MINQEKQLTQDLMESLRCFRKIHWHPYIASNGDLNPSEFFILHKIAINSKINPDKSMSPSDISRDLHVSSPTVTQHITNLETKGFILREIDKKDRRKIKITLTQEGITCLKEAKSSMMKIFDGLSNYLGSEETKMFIKMLTKSTEYFRDQKLWKNDPCCKNFHNKEIK